MKYLKYKLLTFALLLSVVAIAQQTPAPQQTQAYSIEGATAHLGNGEVIENALTAHLDTRFFIASLPDDELGERVILVVEGEPEPIQKTVFAGLGKHEIPKDVFFVKHFQEKQYGKIQRKKKLD